MQVHGEAHKAPAASGPVDGETEGCMVGDVRDWPILEMLYWLHRGNRSAMVRVGEGLDAAVIFVANGFVFRCEWGQWSGEDALARLVLVERAPFRLIQRDMPRPEPNILQNTESLLAGLLGMQGETTTPGPMPSEPSQV